MSHEEKKRIVIDIAKSASEIAMKYFNSGEFYEKSKGGVDLLTEADFEVDKFILEELKKNFPEDSFLTEETAPDNFSSLKEVANLWIVDPIDGTLNFSRGTPYFAISIGQVDQGKPKFGVVVMPCSGDIYFASIEEGPSKNGQPIKVAEITELKMSVIAIGWPWDLQRRPLVSSWIGKMATKVRMVKALGSAVGELVDLAEGRMDGFIHSGLKPWDCAAAAIIVLQAGGKIAKPDGSEWNVFEPEILVTNGILHEDLLELIK